VRTEYTAWMGKLGRSMFVHTRPKYRCGGDGGAGDRLMVQRRRHKVAAAF